MHLPDPKRDYRIGFALTLIGVLLISPDSLIIRQIEADPWVMVFWRGFLVSVTLISVMLIKIGPSAFRQNLIAAGRPGIGVVVCYGATSVGFMIALSLTSVANTLVIMAASPFFAALLARIFQREKVPFQTSLAIAAGFIGIAIVMSGELVAVDATSSLLGNLAALFTALTLASYFVFLRQRRSVNMIPSTAMGAMMSALVSLPIAWPVAGAAALSLDQAYMVAFLGLFLLPVSFGLITLGPRRLPAVEVGLLMLLETVLGPLWVWLFLGEEPGANALVGGAIVLGALTAHSLWRMRQQEDPASSVI